MSNKVAIITVSFNKKAIPQLIEGLSKQTNKDFTFYIIDVSGNDEQYQGLTENMSVLKAANKGYAFGVNKGIIQAVTDGVEKFCVINDDTIVEKDFVDSVTKSLEKYPKSLIGGKIYYASGYEYHKGRYNKKDLGKIIWYAGGTIDWAHSQPKHIGVDELDSKEFNIEQRTEFITGCLVMFDKVVVDRVGLWDESYFLYYEDADYCERVKRAGLNLYYDPSVVIWHMVSRSTDGSGSGMQKKYQQKNLVKYALKYAPWRTKFHVVKNYLL